MAMPRRAKPQWQLLRSAGGGSEGRIGADSKEPAQSPRSVIMLFQVHIDGADWFGPLPSFEDGGQYSLRRAC
jgi:hypothetical protein